MSPSREAEDPELDAEIYQLILWAGEQCGLKSYAKNIVVEWNRRFTVSLGCATYYKTKIDLGAKVWRRVDPAERQRCVVHEACHLFAYQKYVVKGNRRFVQGHGEHWKGLMARCGYPDAPAQFPDPECGKEFQKYVVYCWCQDHFVSPQKMGRIRKGNYRCRNCGAKIRTVPYGDEEKR